jgi:hypothetical protein
MIGGHTPVPLVISPDTLTTAAAAPHVVINSVAVDLPIGPLIAGLEGLRPYMRRGKTHACQQHRLDYLDHQIPLFQIKTKPAGFAKAYPHHFEIKLHWNLIPELA